MPFYTALSVLIFANNQNNMKKLLPLNVAITGILIIVSLTILFHLLVIGGLISPEIVWGGNITSQSNLWLMESVSIIINLVMLLFVLAYAGMLKIKLVPAVFKVGFWVMFLLFALNTLGNLAARHSLETYIFTPLTFLLALFCFRIAAYEFARPTVSQS